MNRWILIAAMLVAVNAWACDDDDDDDEFEGGASGARSGAVCDLPNCPSPEYGVACCTPTAQCGWDPLGLGTNCAPNPGAPLSNNVCVLDACPLPPVGVACCTPFGLCGTDPFATGQSCFNNPPPINIVPEPIDAAAFITCDVDDCDPSELGPSCCLPDGECGVDTLGVGFCFPLPPPPVDAAVPTNPISTTPPEDVTVDGQCPSYIGFFGPIWGCCSPYGACGTFEAGQCLLPVGTPIPLSSAPDGGIPANVLPCDPAEPFEFPSTPQ